MLSTPLDYPAIGQADPVESRGPAANVAEAQQAITSAATRFIPP